MCPDPGCDCVALNENPVGVMRRCPECAMVWHPNLFVYGYHAPDVEGVVREMKAAARRWFIKGVTMVEFQKRVEDWADRLEGSNE